MTETVLTLGGITLQYFEIPNSVPFGGEQRISTKKFIGDKRVLDAMGWDHEPISWSGRFRGQDSTERGRAVEAMAKAGKPISLTWHAFSYSVLIQRFVCDFNASFDIPYQIVCLVIEDLAAPVQVAADVGTDTMMKADGLRSSVLAGRLGDGTLTGLVSTMNTAINKVSQFATATTATINSVLAPVQAVRERVGTLIGQASAVVQNVTTLGGIAPYNPIALNASNLVSNALAMTDLPNLYLLNGVTGRMVKNLDAIGVSGSSITTTSDLYTLAAQQYGDVSAWTTIAKANDLTDPILTGINTIRIPPTQDGSNGVLQT